MRVKATGLGFYGNTLRKEGDEFDIDTRMFSGSWMQSLAAEPAVDVSIDLEPQEDEDATPAKRRGR